MSTNTELAERLARVETKMESLLDAFSEERKEAQQARTVMLMNQQAMEKELTHYKGLLGGVTLVFSGIGVVLIFFKGWLFSKLGIHA
jgi:uncharacterized protein YlxW (UPF0749 family)